MKHLKDWLERLKSRPVSGDYWEDRRRHEALEALAACTGYGDWLTLSTHGNGFAREAAVRELSEQPSPETLVALLERLNDWVPQIRQQAYEAVQRYLAPEHVRALLHALPALMALAERQRADHGPTLAVARAVLQEPELRMDVEAAFATRHGKAARFLFTLLQEVSVEPVALLRMALAHREMTVRQMAVKACTALPAEQARPLLLEAFDKPGASVRVVVLHALLPLLDDTRPVLRAALLDASPSIRALARWAAPREQLDAHSVLMARLHQPHPVNKRDWMGLLGLSHELAVELDESWISAAMLSGISSVRLAAVPCLSKNRLAHRLMALSDSADKVFAKAVEHLREEPWAVLQADLDMRLDRDWYVLPPERREALMHLRPRWQQLAYWLRRLDAAPQERQHWLMHLKNWLSQQYLMVDPVTHPVERTALIERVQQLESAGLLPEGSTKRLR
jgi:HEAT repeat protein